MFFVHLNLYHYNFSSCNILPAPQNSHISLIQSFLAENYPHVERQVRILAMFSSSASYVLVFKTALIGFNGNCHINICPFFYTINSKWNTECFHWCLMELRRSWIHNQIVYVNILALNLKSSKCCMVLQRLLTLYDSIFSSVKWK